MRNIALSNFEGRCLNLEDCEVVCHDQQTIYAYNKGKVIKSQASGDEIIFKLTDNLYPIDESDGEIFIPKALDISYFSEKDTIYIIFFNGDIVSLQKNEAEPENIVGSVSGGIKAAQWSPEKEFIALVTGDDNVILMTNDFDSVSETNLHGGDFGEKQFINVGWGKNETQFRGSEGKLGSKVTKNEEIDVSAENKNEIKIAWRGDAEYFVISSINPNTSKRYLRVFNKNGILQYTSEDINGLGYALDWSPSGNLIASSQVFPNKYSICFFEKNGLKHGEFTLSETHQQISVEDVLWSKDSKILALLIKKYSNESKKSTKFIQLYTVSNYHWYCKYTINFEFLCVPLHIYWDNYKNNTLHIILKKGNKIYYNKYSWLWTIYKSRGSTLKDESLVAVIDGCKLKLSSFKRGIIPPPMCTHEILLPHPINAVSFAPDIQDKFSSNDLCVQLSNNNLLIFKNINVDSKEMSYELVGEIKNLSEDVETCLNVQWVDVDTFMLCIVKMDKGKSKPFLTTLNVNFSTPVVNFKRDDIALQSTVALIRASKTAVLIYDNNNQLYSFSMCKRELENLNSTNKSFIDLEVKDKENGGFSFFGLDNLNKFYLNNINILNNVLSFHVHENFILLTTMKHELLCLNTENEISGFDLSEVYSRRVERGSRIVTSVQKDMKVILQMPRGNLECVQPRPLSLFVLGKYLDSVDYFSAFDLMRKQRINLNLLYDHNPDLFSKNIHLFLEEIKDLQWISLFLSDLSNEDITKTMYSSIYKRKNTEHNLLNENKIDTVCSLIEKTLSEKTDSDRYILPLLISYIKRGKTEFLERALTLLKDLRKKELSGNKSAVTFDEAFKYILYLIDVEELFKVALGMYDFDLVLIIASKSQKDPKEYFQFLNEIKQLEPNYQKFTIDKFLKRYKKALANLIMCEGDDTFNECINFIKSHKLYKYALKLIPENTDRYKNVCVCYGDELLKANFYEEAGIVYMNAGRYDNALTAYRKSGNWQEVLFCAKELKLAENELMKLYLDLAVELTELKQFREAATVYLDYLNDVPECLRVLAKGKLFAEAYRIAYLHQSAYLIMQIVIPEILEQTSHMQLHIGNIKETFIKQKDRLKIVRKQKFDQANDKNDFDDLYSETSTVLTQSNATSCTTNRTYRSAKNKRKQERKLLSLKEGSPHEDFALVTSLHNIVTNCTLLKPEIKELNKFLVKIGEFGKAQNLQKKFEDMLKLIELSKSEIWTPDLFNRRQFYGPQATSNEISAMFMRSENVTPFLLNNKYLVPPETEENVKWKLEILNI